jgi:protein TonB
MSGKINLYTEEWVDIVFDGRNQEYGAFENRQKAPKRHILALTIAVAFFSIAVSAPVLIKVFLPKKEKKEQRVVTLENLKMDAPKEEKQIEAPPPPPVKAAIKFTPPEIKPDEEVADDEMKTQDQLIDSKAAISIADVQGSLDANAVDPADLRKDFTEESNQIYTTVEQMPEFPGGIEEMYKFLGDNLKYPQSAIENGITGRVYVQFVVDKNGRISSIKVIRPLGGGCDEEAIRVVKKMPSWAPGKQNGKSVSVWYTLPINFSLGEQ